MINVGICCDQFGNLQRGGAEVQVEKTVEFLNKTGKINVQYINQFSNSLEEFDLVHFFKSSIEYYPLAAALRKKGIPYGVSTIIFPLHYWRTVYKFRIAGSMPGMLQKILCPAWQYKLWDGASKLYPNTDEEALFIQRILPHKKSHIEIVPNGIDIGEMERTKSNSELFFEKFPQLKDTKFVLNVARIEFRKNQKNLVLACRELDLPIVLIGKVWDNNYYRELQNIGYDKMYYLGPIYDKDILFSAYSASSLFCLPSTLETPGIAAIEAAYYKKPIVITKFGGTRFYFSDHATYVDWRNVKEIAHAIQQSFDTIVDHNELLQRISWSNIANIYSASYANILKKTVESL